MSIKSMAATGGQQLIGLENGYSALCFPEKVDLTKDGGFPNYLEPNEMRVHEVKPHLQFLKRGYLVATGTERCFFDLMFSDLTLCMGLVICDTNPKVKAYVDFNALLLRISATKEEYEILSRTTQSDASFAERVLIIADKMRNGGLPEKVQNYWENHINGFGSVYLKSPKRWRDSKQFEGCKYYQSNIHFNILKSFAESGNIISVIGNINDLRFLKNRTISVVDVSNIPHYCFLDFQAGKDFYPRVIWTDLIHQHFFYQSYVYQPLNTKQNKEFDEVLSVIKSCTFPEKKYPHGDEYALWMTREQRVRNLGQTDPLNASLGAIRSLKTLEFLNWYRSANFLSLSIGLVNMATKDIEALNELSPEEIIEMCALEEVLAFKGELVAAWKDLNPDVYLGFSQMIGWKGAFEKYFSSKPTEFAELLHRLSEASLLEKFTFEFGEERLVALQKNYEEFDVLAS